MILLLVPAELAIAGFGGALTPALIIGLACGWLWALGYVVPQLGLAGGRQPVRWVMLLYGATVLVSYVIAAADSRSSIEVTAADRGLLITAALCGTALLAADGISSRDRLDALVRTLVGAGAIAAVIGILQFFAEVDLSRSVALPGLAASADSAPDAITERSGFNRVAGATLHPIEFSAVLTMVLPLALHVAHWTRRAGWWVAAGLILVAIPLSVSRTGSIGLLIVLLVLFPTWDRARRWQMLRIGIPLIIAVRLAAPGLLGTMRALFLSFFEDPSISSRRSDYANVGDFVSGHLFFGRGFATFLPESFDFLDNQYLLSLVETGIVGVAVMVAVYLTGAGVAFSARRASDDPVTRDLAQSLAAAVLVPLATSATFDFLSFPTARSIAFIMVGCAGALWRIEHASSRARQPHESVRPQLASAPPDERHSNRAPRGSA